MSSFRWMSKGAAGFSDLIITCKIWNSLCVDINLVFSFDIINVYTSFRQHSMNTFSSFYITP